MAASSRFAGGQLSMIEVHGLCLLNNLGVCTLEREVKCVGGTTHWDDKDMFGKNTNNKYRSYY